MGLVRATAMVVGIIIGASIFVQPSEVSRHVSSIGAMFGVWTAAGIVSIAGAMVAASLAAAFPQTGGVYIYLKETVSPAVGFLWVWAMFWSAQSGIIAAIAVVLARYVAVLAPLNDAGIRVVAIGCIVLLSAVNYAGVRAGSSVQTAFTMAKVAAIAAILVAAAVLAGPRPEAGISPGAPRGAREFLLGISAGLFAFGGWHQVTYTAGETHHAEKTIPRALLIGMAIVTVSYLSLNAAYLRVLPLSTVLHSQHIAADAADVLAGPRAAELVAILVIVSAFGGLSGTVLAGPRVYYALARDGYAWRVLGQTHPRFRTPHTAIAAQGVWACALVATGTYRTLFTRVVYTEFLFFALMAIGLMRLRKQVAAAPLLFLAGCAVVVVNQLVADPRESAVGLLLVAAGLPVYYLVASRRPKPLPSSE
jgi:APA family basic amino acid/polyamine antiporter